MLVANPPPCTDATALYRAQALMQDVGGGKPVAVNGVEGLMAMEVSTEEAAERFRSAIGGFRASDLGLGGVAEELVSKLGLDDLVRSK